MSKRLFSYPMDADREAEGMKKVLEQHHIDYYETPGNRWGFSNAALWIKDAQDFEKAQSLFDEYQQEYAQIARKKYKQETGYDPNAPLTQRIGFTLVRLLQNKGSLLLLIFTVVLVFLYLRMFLSLFSK
ncbi:MAG: DUF6164 family protein [Gammaproteobacteria bacterium]|nr:DUF6164 family protein [Gammaproteobacteria bacterium]MDH5800211.1 DUF6164 family protein [Gammaproteobacteria bacterium]